MKKILALLGIILVFFLGIATDKFFLSSSQKLMDDCSSKDWEALRSRLQSSEKMDLFAENDYPITSVVGKVVAVNKESFNVKIVPLGILANPDLDIREVKVDSNTKIYQEVKKTEKEYQEELDASRKSYSESDINKSNGSVSNFPSRYKQILVDKSFIKVGQEILVEAGENIKEKKSFKAQAIVAPLNN